LLRDFLHDQIPHRTKCFARVLAGRAVRGRSGAVILDGPDNLSRISRRCNSATIVRPGACAPFGTAHMSRRRAYRKPLNCDGRHSAPLVRALRDTARPGSRNRHHLSSFPSALRAAHPRRQLLERHFPADQAGECLRLDLATAAALTTTRTRKSPKQSSSFLMWESTRERVRTAEPMHPCSGGERSELYRQSVCAGGGRH
jgi:hypothetical protein